MARRWGKDLAGGYEESRSKKAGTENLIRFSHCAFDLQVRPLILQSARPNCDRRENYFHVAYMDKGLKTQAGKETRRST